jgi:hypothetical protein
VTPLEYASQFSFVDLRSPSYDTAIPENLAHDKWAGMGPARFGLARAQPGMAANGPGPTRSTSHAVLGPGQQPVGRARNNSIMHRPSRHDIWPMRPAVQRHGPTRLAWPDSSRPLNSTDPTTGNFLASGIKPHPNPTWPHSTLGTPQSPLVHFIRRVLLAQPHRHRMAHHLGSFVA